MAHGESEAAAPVRVWGLPLAPYTLEGSLDRIDQLIEEGKPSYFITANLHYAMVSDQNPAVRTLNEKAAFILADGMPLVWAARAQKTPLPCRVAGSDLIWKMGERAAAKGHRLFLLGGAEGIADEAARKMKERYPGLIIAGTACPPFRELTPEEESELFAKIRDSHSQILIIALSQPKGELWLARNCEKLMIPVCVQLGASLDFVAGKVVRAPRFLQRTGLEWAFRLAQEPRRLFGRYARNAMFLMRMLLGRSRRAGRRQSSGNRQAISVADPCRLK
jgi:N-acetylglucosaminyldiphosphoundecaprenol N-acetyl-beta-D-mannosaminyltransferase